MTEQTDKEQAELAIRERIQEIKKSHNNQCLTYSRFHNPDNTIWWLIHELENALKGRAE